MIAAILALLVCIAALAPRADFAATPEEIIKKSSALSLAERKTFLEEGAKKEGQLVFYTSLSLTDYPKIMPYFEKIYPFIKTNTYRATPSGVFTRIDTEARAGRYAVDVVGSAPVEMNVAAQTAKAFDRLPVSRTKGNACRLLRCRRLLASLRSDAPRARIQHSTGCQQRDSAELSGFIESKVEG